MAKKKHKKNSGAIVERKRQEIQLRKMQGRVSREFRDGYTDGVDVGVHQAFIVLMYALHEAEGFGQKRLQRVFDKTVELSKQVENDELTFEEMVAVLRNECRFPLPGLQKIE